MAKVEMDMTEYEALKKVQSVLEQANADNKKMQAEVSRLTEEKIQALADSQNKIIMEDIRTVREYKVSMHDDETIGDAIRDFFRNRPTYFDQPVDPRYSKAQNLMNNIFKTERTQSIDQDKTVKIIGNDEAKDFIRFKLEKEYRGNIENLESQLKAVIEGNAEGFSELKVEHEKELESKDRIIASQKKFLEELHDQIRNLKLSRGKAMLKIDEMKINMWNYSTTKHRVRKILMSKSFM